MAQVCFSIGKARRAEMPWVWLGLFGAVHGFHEWLDLTALSLGDSRTFLAVRTFLMVVSFVFLAEFGRAGTARIRGGGPGRWALLPPLAFALSGITCGLAGLDVTARYTLCLVGGLWASYALLIAANSKRLEGRGWLMTAAIALFLYAITGGLFVPAARFFPASVVNSDLFLKAFGFPVELARGSLAFIAALAITGSNRTLGKTGAENNRFSAFMPIIAVILIVVVGWVVTDIAGTQDFKVGESNAVARVQLAAAAINPDRVVRLLDARDGSGTSDHDRLEEQLRAICEANCSSDKESHLYCRTSSLMVLKDGRFVPIVHTGAVGHHFPEPLKSSKKVTAREVEDYSSGATTLSPIMSDGEGAWLTTAAPIRNSATGKVIAQLVMDIEADNWIKSVAVERLFCIATILFLSLSAIAIFIAWQRSRESEANAAALSIAAVRIAKDNRLRVITSALGEGLLVKDREGRLTSMNPEAERLLGWSEPELAGRHVHPVIHFQNADGTEKLLDDCLSYKTLTQGGTFRSEDDVFTRKDGTVFPISYVTTPIMEDGAVAGAVTAFQDISERKQAEEALAERGRLTALAADVGTVLTTGDTLQKILQGCAETMVHHLGAAFARIWTMDDSNFLVLQASAGIYTNLDGVHSRIIPGVLKVGIIASERKPYLTNSVIGDPHISDQGWARREGMVAFAGYPLVIDDRVVGVMAMFSRSPLSDTTMTALSSIADEIAIGIERKLAVKALKRSNDLLNSLSLIQSRFIEDANPKALFGDILDSFLLLTSSKYGFIGEVLYAPDRSPYLKTHAITNIAWDKQTRAFYDEFSATGMEFHNLKTLFGEVLSTGKPVIANDPLTDPRRGGLPPNHPPLSSFMGMPFYRGGKLVGVVGIADRPGGYNDRLIGYMQPFLDTCANIVESHRNELRRKEAEDEKDRLLKGIAASTEGISFTDEHQRYIYMNEAHAALFGYTPEELIGKTWRDLTPPEHLAQTEAAMSDTLLNRKVGELSGEGFGLTKDGARVPLEFKVTAFWDEAGDDYQGHVCIARDITDRKKLERQREDFFAMVTHDLKSPLTAIMGYTEILLSGPSGSMEDDSREMVSHIRQSSLKVFRIVEDFLTISRLESGSVNMKESLVDIPALLAETYIEFQQPASKKGLTFEKELSGDFPRVLADRMYIYRAVANLLQNAVNYTPKNGSVKLSARRVSEDGMDFIAISVHDTGMGISQAEKGRVFEKYYRSEKTASVKGSGLGLAVAKAVAEAHGGRVELDSTEGKGSVFTLFIPVRRG